MILAYSGSTSGESLPERVLGLKDPPLPAVMLTYYEIYQGRGDTLRRFKRHAKRRKKGKRKNGK